MRRLGSSFAASLCVVPFFAVLVCSDDLLPVSFVGAFFLRSNSASTTGGSVGDSRGGIVAGDLDLFTGAAGRSALELSSRRGGLSAFLGGLVLASLKDGWRGERSGGTVGLVAVVVVVDVVVEAPAALIVDLALPLEPGRVPLRDPARARAFGDPL